MSKKMKKHAHLVTRPNHQVGDKVLALCGEEWKVTTLWDDVPADHPICRPCVDLALAALDEADVVIQSARVRAMLMENSLERLTSTLTPEQPLHLDQIAEADQEHRDEQEAKRARKAEKKRAKHTCTCTWEDADTRTYDPDCPVHGHGPDEPKIERGPGGRPVVDVPLPEEGTSEGSGE